MRVPAGTWTGAFPFSFKLDRSLVQEAISRAALAAVNNFFMLLYY
jgi:hypothetical protein